MSRCKLRGRAKGPLRKIEALGPRSATKTRAHLECGHRLWIDDRAIYATRCWICGRVERGECVSCATPLVAGACPNKWDGTGGTVPPRGRHA